MFLWEDIEHFVLIFSHSSNSISSRSLSLEVPCRFNLPMYCYGVTSLQSLHLIICLSRRLADVSGAFLVDAHTERTVILYHLFRSLIKDFLSLMVFKSLTVFNDNGSFHDALSLSSALWKILWIEAFLLSETSHLLPELLLSPFYISIEI